MTNTATEHTTVTFLDLDAEPVTTAYIVTFTPEQARRIVRASIGAEINFRSLTEDKRFSLLVQQMRKGQWNWTDADPIRLHTLKETGEVVASDGQHRLAAASQARKKLRSLVLFGDEWKSGLHLDRNKPRNASQYLAHEYGLKGAAPYVAMARFELARDRAYVNRTTASYEGQSIDDESIIEFVVNNQNEMTWAASRAQTGAARGFHTTGYAVFLFEALRVSHELASQFHDDMKAQDLDSLDPLSQLRRVVQSRFAQTGRRAAREYTVSNLVKAWNFRAERETLTRWVNAQTDEVFYPAGYPLPKVAKVTK